MSANLIKLKHHESYPQSGVHFRLICISGNMSGESFIISGNRVVLGRSDQVDLQILDIKLSREHAEIVKMADYCVLTDLGSQNGIYVNDQKVTQKNLEHKDRILLGETVLEYIVEQGSDSKGPLSLVPKQRESSAVKNSRKESVQKSERKPKRGALILVAVGIIILFSLLDTDEKSIEDPGEQKEKVTDEYELALRGQRKGLSNSKDNERVKNILKKAIRESREGNYYRAMGELELAETISQRNPTIEAYKRIISEKRDRTIESFIKNAKRDQNALKLESAVGQNCAIIRMLHNNSQDSRFIEASERIKELEARLGRTEGETECLQK